jgi:hypothetical protein
MSNLRLINETSFSSVATVDVTDVFSADFDIYKITLGTGANYGFLKFINSAGSITTDNSYDTARLNLKTNTTFTETRVTNQTVGWYMFSELQSSTGGGNTIWIFNPYSSSSYTFGLGQTIDVATSTSNRIAKTIGVYKNTQSLSGYRVDTNGGSISGSIRTYGLRVNS